MEKPVEKTRLSVANSQLPQPLFHRYWHTSIVLKPFGISQGNYFTFHSVVSAQSCGNGMDITLPIIIPLQIMLICAGKTCRSTLLFIFGIVPIWYAGYAGLSCAC